MPVTLPNRLPTGIEPNASTLNPWTAPLAVTSQYPCLAGSAAMAVTLESDLAG